MGTSTPRCVFVGHVFRGTKLRLRSSNRQPSGYIDKYASACAHQKANSPIPVVQMDHPLRSSLLDSEPKVRVAILWRGGGH